MHLLYKKSNIYEIQNYYPRYMNNLNISKSLKNILKTRIDDYHQENNINQELL